MVSVTGPHQAILHDRHDEYEGGANRLTNWDALPDDHFEQSARACRFRDGRDQNPFGAPVELYTHLALMLSYCRAALLRRNVCSLQLIPDDVVPVVDGPSKHDANTDYFEFREKT